MTKRTLVPLDPNLLASLRPTHGTWPAARMARLAAVQQAIDNLADPALQAILNSLVEMIGDKANAL